MLLVAIVPTGNYNWGNGPSFDESTGQLVYPTPSPTDYAICHIGRAKTTDKLTFASMVISVLLIAFGFLSRVVRLHKTLSVRVVGGTRRYVSEKVFEWLQKVYDWCHPGTTPSGIRRLLLYRPLLALFLSVRVISDAWTSMFVEVFWLLMSFVWGTLRFFGTFNLYPQGNGDWTFGQIIPVVLLAAPLLAVAEYLYPESSEESGHQQSTSAAPSDGGNNTGSGHAATASRRGAPRPDLIQPSTHLTNSVPGDPPSRSALPSASPSPRALDNAASEPPAAPRFHPSGIRTDDAQATRHSPNDSSPVDPTTDPLPRSSTLQLAASALSTPPDRVRDDPGLDFYTETVWYKIFLGFVVLDILSLGLYIVIVYGTFDQNLILVILPPKVFWWTWLPISVFLSLVNFVLYALMIEAIRESPTPQLSPRVKANIATQLQWDVGVFLLGCQLFPYQGLAIWGPPSAILFYLWCSISYWIYAKITAWRPRG